MAKIFLCFLCSIFTLSAFSQTTGDYNYSIAIRGYGLMQMPKILNETEPDAFTNTVLNGMMFKFNDNLISYRINGTYYNGKKRFFNNCTTCEEANGKLLDYSFKLGFEKSFNYAKIQPYFAVDMGFRASKFTGDLENRNPLKTAEAAALTISRIESSKASVVVSPVVGFKLNPNEILSFYIESYMDFLYSYEREDITLTNASNTRKLNTARNGEYLLNPILIGLQIHLGSNK